MFDAATREREPDTYVPYVGHAAPGVIVLDDGGLLIMLGVGGLAHEMADDDHNVAEHSQLNITLRNLAADRLVLSTHLVRGMADGSDYPTAQCRSAFSRALDDAYRARLLGNRLWRNDLFVSVLLRPSQAGGKRAARVLNPRRRGDLKRAASAQDMERIEAASATLMEALSAYAPRRLGLRTNGKGVVFSEPAEALRLILTGQREPVPLVSGHLGGAIYTDRVIVGREALEIRHPGSSTVAAGFGLREYPAGTHPAMFDDLLSAPFAFCLHQTFGFLSKQVAMDRLTRKQNQLVASNDKAASQVADLIAAQDALQRNAWCMGDHHLTLVAYADSLRALADVAPVARRYLANCGAVIAREDLALEAVYWAQLPGNMHLRSRPGAITSRNFAAMSPLHNYPPGATTGHWGGKIALLRTVAGTGFGYHFHVGETGNTFVTGPVRRGKSTTLLMLVSQAERVGAQAVFFDKDRGAEIFARAVGGSYLALPSGSPSGLAPLKALTDAPGDIAFLARLFTGCIIHGGNYEMTEDDDRRLDLGLRSLMTLDPADRSIKELRNFMGHSDPNGAGARLQRWCQGRELGWALDGNRDDVRLDAGFVGFDMTAILDDADVRGPVMAYLFHRVLSIADGRRLLLVVDEFWKALLDPAFSGVIHDALKTFGKLNVAVILATQSARDALASPIAHTIIEQCATQIHMPNPRADYADYVDGCKLTEAEFNAICGDLAQGGRRFLLKQGDQSIAIDMDLAGMEDYVAVLSGKRNTLRLMERLIRQHGDAPEAWLPHFYAGWRTASEGEEAAAEPELEDIDA